MLGQTPEMALDCRDLCLVHSVMYGTSSKKVLKRFRSKSDYEDVESAEDKENTALSRHVHRVRKDPAINSLAATGRYV